MPLHHSSAEAVETATVYGASAPKNTPAASEPNHNAPRYDAEAVRKIFARAEAIEAQHRATLTPDAVIALGQEVGMEPEFIRRALAEREAKLDGSTNLSSVQRRVQSEQDFFFRPFTRQQWVLAFLPAFFYFAFCLLLMAIIRRGLNFSNSASFWLYDFSPAVLAVCVGSWARSKRVGAMAGGLLGLAALSALMTATAINQGPQPNFKDFILFLSVFSGCGAALGTISAKLSQMLFASRRKRHGSRFVGKIDDPDKIRRGEWA